MRSFIKSDRIDNIFYGDLFRISGKNCLIFGNGKTKACRACIESESDQLALDFVCLTSEKNDLYGHFEMKIRHKLAEDPIKNKVKINYFIRMLNQEETSELKKLLNDSKDKVYLISMNEYIRLSEFNINFNISFNSSNKDRISIFKNLVKDKNIKCLLVPWCDSHEEKGELIKRFIFKDII